MRFKKRADRGEYNNGFSYYGFGNVRETFNRKAKPAFQDIKAFYQEQILRYDDSVHHTSYGKLTEEEKIEIRNHVKAIIDREKMRQRNSYIIYASFTVIAVILTFVVMN